MPRAHGRGRNYITLEWPDTKWSSLGEPKTIPEVPEAHQQPKARAEIPGGALVPGVETCTQRTRKIGPTMSSCGERPALPSKSTDLLCSVDRHAVFCRSIGAYSEVRSGAKQYFALGDRLILRA